MIKFIIQSNTKLSRGELQRRNTTFKCMWIEFARLLSGTSFQIRHTMNSEESRGFFLLRLFQTYLTLRAKHYFRSLSYRYLEFSLLKLSRENNRWFQTLACWFHCWYRTKSGPMLWMTDARGVDLRFIIEIVFFAMLKIDFSHSLILLMGQ